MSRLIFNQMKTNRANFKTNNIIIIQINRLHGLLVYQFSEKFLYSLDREGESRIQTYTTSRAVRSSRVVVQRSVS